MPFPPPPPPPPGPPPPPTFSPAATAPVSPEGRNLLLQSIRQGTSLKKTVTNDKSAPAISGSVRPSSSSSNTSSSSSGSPRINGSATLGRNNGLAGLFASGMPKLKPTGVDIGQTTNSQSLTSLPSATATGKQEQTRRQFNVDIKNRGPPPKPPPATQKPTMPQDGVYLEMRAKSSDRQNSFSSITATEIVKSKSPSAYQFAPLSAKNFPNAKTPPPFKTNLQSPNVFIFPPLSLKGSDSFGTFPSRVSHNIKTYKQSPRPPLITVAPMDIAKSPTVKSPSSSSGKDDYNRFRNSSMTNPAGSFNTHHSPAYPTSPKPVSLSKLSQQTEFKIQRPHLSLAVGKSEMSSTSTSDSVLTGPLHNRSSSTTSLNNNNTWTQPIPRVAMKAPPGGYGKPNVAPKPPGIAAKSPGKLVNGRAGVTRAQSMRAPRSPPVAPPQGQMSLLPNQSELYRGAPMFHQSQDSLLHTPPPPKHHTLPSPRTAPPNRPPLRPPQTRPPPPPPNRIVMSSPPCPPPPPPTQAPPPLPHRVPLQTHRIPPVPASLNPAPPPPPARHSSMRNGMPPSFSSKLEARYAEKFHVREEFPPPQPFMGVTKIYNSRTAKQPAPQPPQPVQLPWPKDNSSTC